MSPYSYEQICISHKNIYLTWSAYYGSTNSPSIDVMRCHYVAMIRPCDTVRFLVSRSWYIFDPPFIRMIRTRGYTIIDFILIRSTVKIFGTWRITQNKQCVNDEEIMASWLSTLSEYHPQMLCILVPKLRLDLELQSW